MRFDWRTPYAGLPGWTIQVDSGVHLFPDCVRWSLPEARRRRG